jgi:hypothetical protein
MKSLTVLGLSTKYVCFSVPQECHATISMRNLALFRNEKRLNRCLPIVGEQRSCNGTTEWFSPSRLRESCAISHGFVVFLYDLSSKYFLIFEMRQTRTHVDPCLSNSSRS